MSVQKRSANILLVGSPSVGKRSFVSALGGRAVAPADVPKLSFVDLHSSGINVTRITLAVTICESENEGVVGKLDGALLMFDVTSCDSYYTDVPRWHAFLRRSFGMGDDRVVLVGSKVNSRDRAVGAAEITFHRKHNLQYSEVAAQSGYNVHQPALFVARRLLGDSSLRLLTAPEVELAQAPQWKAGVGVLAEATQALEQAAAASRGEPLTAHQLLLRAAAATRPPGPS
jgi:GTP-binding nuclear protein Ran